MTLVFVLNPHVFLENVKLMELILKQHRVQKSQHIRTPEKVIRKSSRVPAHTKKLFSAMYAICIIRHQLPVVIKWLQVQHYVRVVFFSTYGSQQRGMNYLRDGNRPEESCSPYSCCSCEVTSPLGNLVLRSFIFQRHVTKA